MTPTEPPSLLETSLHSLPLLARGKVRDNYAVGGDRLLMVASDRLSAFDVVMGEPIPGKGALLTRMALFWFDAAARHRAEPPDRRRSAEAVVASPMPSASRCAAARCWSSACAAAGRGGGARLPRRQRLVRSTSESGTVCGVPLPPGLVNASRLPAPIFTPATKAAMGDHDENIDFERMVGIVGAERWRRRCATPRSGSTPRRPRYALERGIIIADTKFEFGLDADGTLTLMDEVLTPDSSRFWPVEGYEAALREGRNPPSYDKQFVRDWLEQARVDGRPWNKRAPAPSLPAEIVEKTAAKYREALTRLGA